MSLSPTHAPEYKVSTDRFSQLASSVSELRKSKIGTLPLLKSNSKIIPNPN